MDEVGARSRAGAEKQLDFMVASFPRDTGCSRTSEVFVRCS
jgi:hypothetical protein